MLRRLFVIVALVAVLSPGALHALSPAMDPNGTPTAEATSDPEDRTELSPAMDPNGLYALPPGDGWTGWLHGLLSQVLDWIV